MYPISKRHVAWDLTKAYIGAIIIGLITIMEMYHGFEMKVSYLIIALIPITFLMKFGVKR
jgi:hypothetical protein|tara:strand:- start:3279 stop:3458 length:180 start_codon:yes stop_codon:yes gene_type:complete